MISKEENAQDSSIQASQTEVHESTNDNSELSEDNSSSAEKTTDFLESLQHDMVDQVDLNTFVDEILQLKPNCH